jgi:hypothetical protein
MRNKIEDEVLTEWRALSLAALNRDDGWQFGVEDGEPDAVRAEYVDAYDRGTPGVCWYVHVPAGPEHGEVKSLIVATTGNGPTSEAHAKFIAWSSPTNVRALIDDLVLTRDERDTEKRAADGLRAVVAAARAWVDVRDDATRGPVQLSVLRNAVRDLGEK